MRPISELKGFNMERILVSYQHGYITTGFYKDGMIQLDRSEDWHHPSKFEGFMLITDFNKLVKNNL